jgi:hypothetical protein
VTSPQILARFAFVLVLFPLVGLGFAWLAWRIGRAWGGVALVGAWIVASSLATGLMALRIHQQQAALGFTVEQQQRAPIDEWFLPFWLVVFGTVAWRVHSRRHSSSSSFDRSIARSSLGALFVGFIAYFIVFVAYDIFTAR